MDEHTKAMVEVSCQPDWMRSLPVQQQTVLFLASRGPDGVEKVHPSKVLVRMYRASVFMAAYYGRMLEPGEDADTFMNLRDFVDDGLFEQVLKIFFENIDGLPHHYIMHLMHGAQILGYKHPSPLFQERWTMVYERICADCHVTPESEEEMDRRLSDWDRVNW